MSDDLINQPPHYIEGRKLEPIDVIEDWGLGFHLGNAVKYIARAGRKTENPVADLEKAVWYLNRYADKIEREAPQEYPFGHVADGFGLMSHGDPSTLAMGPLSTPSPDVLSFSNAPSGVTHKDVIDFESWKPKDWES